MRLFLFKIKNHTVSINKNISILESVERVEHLLKKKVQYSYSEQNRIGDHICYYSDLTKFKSDYPNWNITHSIDDIFEEMAETYHAQS